MSSGGLHCEIRRALRLLARCRGEAPGQGDSPLYVTILLLHTVSWMLRDTQRPGRMTNQRANAMGLISKPSYLPYIVFLSISFHCRLLEYVIINSGLVKRSEEETVTCISVLPGPNPDFPASNERRSLVEPTILAQGQCDSGI